jgi:hypothetical protein
LVPEGVPDEPLVEAGAVREGEALPPSARAGTVKTALRINPSVTDSERMEKVDFPFMWAPLPAHTKNCGTRSPREFYLTGSDFR